MKRFTGVLLFACACALPSGAFAQTTAVKCRYVTDASVPITTSGLWCLKANVVGRGIIIDASDVILDLKGYSIINSGNATAPTDLEGYVAGVLAWNGTNITVRNGIIRGFDLGVQLGYPSGTRGTVTIEKLMVQGSRRRGISVLGLETVNILDNVITNTSGADTAGIYARGQVDPNDNINHSVLAISRNRVHDTQVNGSKAAGIAARLGSSTIIENNVVTDVYQGGAGLAMGIDVFNYFPCTTRLTNNAVINSRPDIGSTGISAISAESRPGAYTGPIEVFGLIRTSRIVGFDTGLYVAATKNEPTRQYSVPTWSLTNNVVSGAKTGQAYFGGQQVPASNRTE